MSQVLFAISVLLWTGSWLLIPLQLRLCPVTTAIGWRFVIAAVALTLYCAWRGIKPDLRLSSEDWVRLLVQGLGNFGLNYWMVYLAASRMNFALVAMVFMLLPLFNALGAKLFLDTPLPRFFQLRLATAFVGILLVFLPELLARGSLGDFVSGVICALSGMSCASVGNLLATQTQPKMGALPNIAAASAIGGIGMLLIALLTGDGLWVPISGEFLASLLYLGVMAGAVAFVAYFELIGRIGATNAASVVLVIPFMALIASSILDQIHWGLLTVVGVMLVTMGNILANLGERRIADHS